MNQSPAYLMYPDDILSSGRVNALSPLEELWYRRAIDFGWKNGGMPSDPQEFAGWVGRGCTEKDAEKLISKFYFPDKKDASRVVNERQEKERKLFLKKRKQKSEAGKRGMAKRWEHKNNTDNSVITENNIPIPIPIVEEKEKSKRATAPKPKPKKPPQTFDELVATFTADSDYAAIDVQAEAIKAADWVRKKPGREFTKRFFTEWLSRVDVPVELPAAVHPLTAWRDPYTGLPIGQFTSGN